MQLHLTQSELRYNPLNIKKMEKKVIKLRVNNDVTSCAQLRVREKSDPNWTDFVCGIDVQSNIMLTTYHHLWGHSFPDLVTTIIETCRRINSSDFRNLDNIIELVICDDSQVLQLGIDYDDSEYFEKCDKITQECKAKLAKNSKAFYGLTQNGDGDWEGTVEIYI